LWSPSKRRPLQERRWRECRHYMTFTVVVCYSASFESAALRRHSTMSKQDSSLCFSQSYSPFSFTRRVEMVRWSLQYAAYPHHLSLRLRCSVWCSSSLPFLCALGATFSPSSELIFSLSYFPSLPQIFANSGTMEDTYTVYCIVKLYCGFKIQY
jgi:hypothetical protein